MDRAQADDCPSRDDAKWESDRPGDDRSWDRGRSAVLTGSSRTRSGRKWSISIPSNSLPKFCVRFPPGCARLHRAPFQSGAEENTIRVALIDPLDTQTIDDLALRVGPRHPGGACPRQQIRERLKKHYGDETSSMEEILKQLGETGELMTLDGDRSDGRQCRSRSERAPRSSASLI